MLLAGFVVLMMLMVTVIYNDLTRISWIEAPDALALNGVRDAQNLKSNLHSEICRNRAVSGLDLATARLGGRP